MHHRLSLTLKVHHSVHPLWVGMSLEHVQWKTCPLEDCHSAAEWQLIGTILRDGCAKFAVDLRPYFPSTLSFRSRFMEGCLSRAPGVEEGMNCAMVLLDWSKSSSRPESYSWLSPVNFRSL